MGDDPTTFAVTGQRSTVELQPQTVFILPKFSKNVLVPGHHTNHVSDCLILLRN